MKLKYKTIEKQESYGQLGSFGIHIEVAASENVLENLNNFDFRRIKNQASENILTYMQSVAKQQDPNTAIETTNNKKLLSIFEHPIYVEEISNEYCSDWCCKHLPWFVVYNAFGPIKIGWRKRVINIDWSKTIIHYTADELFPDERVTKGDKYIHANNLEKAKEYITKLNSYEG